MGWLVARTDMPLRRTVRAAGDGVVRDAAVPRRHRLGAAGGAQQRAAQPGLPRRHRRRAGRASVQHLHADRADLRHLLLHVSLCVRAGRQCARPHRPAISRTPPSILGGSTWDDRAARHHSAGAAGAARRRAGRLPAGDDAVRLAGDPGAAGRLPHHDHQDLEPVPVSAQAGARRRRLAAAAGAHRPAAARRAHDPRPPRLFGGRRQAERAAPRPARRAGDGLALGARLAGAAVPGVPALRRAAQRGVLAGRLAVRLVRQFHVAQHRFRVLRTVGDQARAQEHVHPRHR